LAFASILETRHQNNIKQLVTSGFANIIAMLNDPDKSVRVTSSWCIEKICELHSNILNTEKNASILLEGIIGHLNDTNKVVTHLCTSIHHFASFLKPHPDQVSSKKFLLSFRLYFKIHGVIIKYSNGNRFRT
jgi:hypothetical protein